MTPMARIFGDTMAIVMVAGQSLKPGGQGRFTVSGDQKHVQPCCLVLQGDALMLWQRFRNCAPTEEECALPLVRQMIALGALSLPDCCETRIGSPLRDSDDDLLPITTFDQGALSLWAFQNRIPLTVHLELTRRCNLRCSHCYCLLHNNDELLTTVEMIRIIDDLAAQGTFFVVLTGGEIFARADIFTLLEHLERRQFVVRLNTNGTLLDECRIAALARFTNIYRVHVSLYGSTPAIHDEITGMNGSHALTVRAIEQLVAAGIRIRINCSVTRSNVADLPAIKRDIADRLGVPIHFDSTIFPRDDGETINTDDQLTPEQEAEFSRFRITDRLPDSDAAQPSKPKLCKAGVSFLAICEDGSVYPCLKMKRLAGSPVGNIAAMPFMKLWNEAPQLLSLRASLDERLRQCDICKIAL